MNSHDTKPYNEATDDACAVKPFVTVKLSRTNCLVQHFLNATHYLYMDLFTDSDGSAAHCFRPKHTCEHCRRKKQWLPNVARIELGVEAWRQHVQIRNASWNTRHATSMQGLLCSANAPPLPRNATADEPVSAPNSD